MQNAIIYQKAEDIESLKQEKCTLTTQLEQSENTIQKLQLYIYGQNIEIQKLKQALKDEEMKQNVNKMKELANNPGFNPLFQYDKSCYKYQEKSTQNDDKISFSAQNSLQVKDEQKTTLTSPKTNTKGFDL